MARPTPTNRVIAEVLERIADLLEANEENSFRVMSYRNAARAVRGTKKPLAATAKAHGPAGLMDIKGIGERLAGLIDEFVRTGKIELLHDLEKGAPRKSGRVKEEQAAGTSARPLRSRMPIPDVSLILAVDSDYRKKAGAGKLKMIAPKKLNPEGKSWLPILSTEREGWAFTVMFSNTSRAHDLGKTHDWVVIYFRRGAAEQQCTVVTEQRGNLKGKRVIRGREQECAAAYGS